MGVAIVGCGRAGTKRAAGLKPGEVVACLDEDRGAAAVLAATYGCDVATDLDEITSDPRVTAVIVATAHRELAPVASAALRAGKDVLVEKPGSRTSAEAAVIKQVAHANGARVAVGFNHRFHPAVAKARQLVADRVLGDLFWIRGVYGHGGRPGYETEWRMDRAASGGGQLMDQGSHLIDLSRWIAGELTVLHVSLSTRYWDADVEDNAFLSCRSADGVDVSLHASWTEWKNTFRFEVCGSRGLLRIEGLGGSYGTERWSLYLEPPGLGPPDTTIWEYPGPDASWADETSAFLNGAQAQLQGAGIDDAVACLQVVEAAYRSQDAR